MDSDRCNFSFITYALPNEEKLIKKIGKSIKNIKQKLKKEGKSLEWIVIIDGDSDISDIKHADKILHNYSEQGISISKNKALDKTVGEWLIPIDTNETLDIESISILLNTLSQNDNINWILSNPTSLEKQDNNHIHSGYLSELYQQNKICIKNPNNIIIKRKFLKQSILKGWLNIPSHEDIGTLLVISELSDGIISSLPLSTKIEKSEKIDEAQSKIITLNKPFSFNKIIEVINKIRDKTGRKEVVFKEVA